MKSIEEMTNRELMDELKRLLEKEKEVNSSIKQKEQYRVVHYRHHTDRLGGDRVFDSFEEAEKYTLEDEVVTSRFSVDIYRELLTEDTNGWIISRITKPYQSVRIDHLDEDSLKKIQQDYGISNEHMKAMCEKWLENNGAS